MSATPTTLLSPRFSQLDGLPLAIELVAHRAQAEPDAATVLDQWDAERSRYPARGGGKDYDLAASVALSLNSSRMTPGGRRLYSLLGRLPSGLRRADLVKVMRTDGYAAAATLRDTGLVISDTVRLRMLAPVRELAAAEPLGDAERDGLFAHFSTVAEWPTRCPISGRSRLTGKPCCTLERSSPTSRRQSLSRRRPLTRPRQHDFGRPTDQSRRRPQGGGALRPAADAFRAAQQQFELATQADPANAAWRRDLSVSLNRLADILHEQGDLPEAALAAYARAKDVREQLADAEPGNLDWQRGCVGELEQAGRHVLGKSRETCLARWAADVPVHGFETPICAYAAMGIGAS